MLAVNSVTLGGLLFLLSAGFSLIFGLRRIPNLAHGSFFMLGGYFAASLIGWGVGFWPAALISGLLVAALGGAVERLVLRRLAGAELAQVLVTLGLSFMIADVCLTVWTGDPVRIDTPRGLAGVAALVSGLLVAALGGVVERLILRRLAGAELAQVLVTLGLSFMIADVCLKVWTGDPVRIDTPPALQGVTSVGSFAFPTYRLAISLVAVAFAVALWLLMDRTRLGAMIRAGVDDPDMARVAGIRVSRLFTIVFCLGAWLAGFAGVIGGPILSVYPGLDQEMLPLALVVVILGGSGSLLGSLVGSFVVGFLYNFGQAMFPELAYVVLFLPMLLVLVVRPQGLFGRPAVGSASRWPPRSWSWPRCPSGPAAPSTSTSGAKSSSTPSSRSASTSWWATRVSSRWAMPGSSAARPTPRPAS